jgi:molecular chaperone HscB
MSLPDPFALLGLPRRFSLDRKDAEAKHRELSRTLHPDRYAGASSAERRMVLSKAIEVNEAWRIVRDPVRRAEALLLLEGLETEVGETREPKPSPSFLMEVLEAREHLEEAKDARDCAAVAKAVEGATAKRRAVEGELEATIDAAIETHDRGALRAAVPLLGRLRYAARFLEEAAAIEERLAGL